MCDKSNDEEWFSHLYGEHRKRRLSEDSKEPVRAMESPFMEDKGLQLYVLTMVCLQVINDQKRKKQMLQRLVLDQTNGMGLVILIILSLQRGNSVYGRVKGVHSIGRALHQYLLWCLLVQKK